MRPFIDYKGQKVTTETVDRTRKLAESFQKTADRLAREANEIEAALAALEPLEPGDLVLHVGFRGAMANGPLVVLDSSSVMGRLLEDRYWSAQVRATNGRETYSGKREQFKKVGRLADVKG